MDELCNTSADNQAKYLIPNPLKTACSPAYPHSTGIGRSIPRIAHSQVDPSIRQALWNATIALDQLGGRWGTSGVRRSPAFAAAGWTPDLSGRVQAPTLVIRGALDDQAPEQATRALYNALGGPKAYVTVSCGSHELVYEQPHTQLLQASAEWLRFGTYEERPSPSSKYRAAGSNKPQRTNQAAKVI